MIGLLIVTHGNLGDSLIQCATHVLGSEQKRVMHLDVSASDDPDELYARAQGMLSELDQGDGVLLLSDIYGATPCNVVCRLLDPGRVEGVAGVSLPMLVRALTYRSEPLTTVVDKALSGGREGALHIPTSTEKAGADARRRNH